MWLVGVPAGVDNLPALRVGVWHGDHQEEGGGVGVADTGVVACTHVQCTVYSYSVQYTSGRALSL